MLKKFLISLAVLACSLAYSSYAWAVNTYDSTNFSADGRKWQPVPTGHVPGKDNGHGTGTHNAGEDCGICHTPGGKAGNFLFTVGGTIYEDRAARRPLKGAEVILQDVRGNTVSMTTNETGNFWTFSTLASNPCTISSHGITDKLYTVDGNNQCVPTVPSSDSRTWQYKAWVKYGDRVRRMVTIAPIGGAGGTTPRMGCSMHHAAMGGYGGAWSGKKDTLPSYPATNLSFKKHILPIFRIKCAPCHVPGSTKTRLATRSDIDLTATGALTVIDYSQGRDYTSKDGTGSTSGGVTKAGISDLVSGFQANPDASPVLLKTLLQSPGSAVIHAGGEFWTPMDADYRALRQWIVEGAQTN